MDNPATILSLFTGIGGLDHGIRMVFPEARVVCGVERELPACQVLAARMEDGSIDAYPCWSDVTTFDGTPWRGRVDIITGGFPCQDISCAGKGAGLAGARSGLWWEYVRLIREVEPRYVFVENVGALLVRGLDAVLGAFAELGFDAEWGTLRASDVGAPHRRERVFILAYRNDGRGGEDQQPSELRAEGPLGPSRHRRGAGQGEVQEEPCGAEPVADRNSDERSTDSGEPDTRADGRDDSGGRSEQVPPWPPGPSDTAGWEYVLERWPWLAPAIGLGNSSGNAGGKSQKHARRAVGGDAGSGLDGPSETQPALRGMAHELPSRVDRLRALGNAVVPAQAATALRILWDRMTTIRTLGDAVDFREPTTQERGSQWK